MLPSKAGMGVAHLQLNLSIPLCSGVGPGQFRAEAVAEIKCVKQLHLHIAVSLYSIF